MLSKQHMTISVGERRWIWAETIFLAGVLPPGMKGGAKDEEELTRHISLAVLETKGIPLVKQHVVLQLTNDQEMDPQLSADKKAEAETPNGLWVTIWVQWLPEVARREKLRAKNATMRHEREVVDRNYMITASVNSGVDAKLMDRWGTANHEPPINEDRFALKAIPRR